MNHCDYYNRPVYKSELLDYWKKTDYFEGLSNLEKQEIRQNLGIGSSGSSLTETYTCSFEEFNEYRQKGKLTIGKRYIIEDFQTIYASNVKSGEYYEAWGTDDSVNPSKTYSLIVTAISPGQIDPRVFILGKSWVVEYDPEPELIDNNTWTKGKITYLRDENNNSAYFDFKNIKIRKYAVDLEGLNFNVGSYIDFYTFSRISNNRAYDNSDNYQVCNNYIGANSINNIFIGEVHDNIFDANVHDNIFAGGIFLSHITAGSCRNTIPVLIQKTTGLLIEVMPRHNDDILSNECSKTIMTVGAGIAAVWLDGYSYSLLVSIIKDALNY